MQFYKIQGMIQNEKWAEENDNSAREHRNIHKIAMRSRDFNEKIRKQTDAFLFSVDATGDRLTAGLILKTPEDVENLAACYTKGIGLDVTELSIEETTMMSIRDMLEKADREDYIEDSFEVLEQFELEFLSFRGRYTFRFGERILVDSEKDQIYQKAGRYQMDDDLFPELDRIFKGKTKKRIEGHPVHYMIQTDDLESRREVCRLLLQSLYSKQRLRSRRYSFLNISAGSDMRMYDLECFYKSCKGGAVLVRYSTSEETEEDCATGEMETLLNLCEVMKQYHNQVLTIFCLPRECTNIREFLFENLGNISLVEIRDVPSTGERAKEYLQFLAKECGLRTDKKLFAMLEDDRGYLGTEMREMFDEWYNRKLKTSIYPEYKEIATVKKETAKAKPKGTAFDELMNMIGLEESKKVIKQALDFFKAQKLFADKGMNMQRPSMHMVFTGNPGTAKTTVARLFARIMRENGTLSKGHLVEVGRGDLVGKYVGWTATIVKKKFKEASGGVLFIDEAYSLADGRHGSFGEEAINTIVQEMENHRDELVVIFAGYPDEMEGFLKSNPGLRSRIAFHVPFADYDTEELCRIATYQASKMELRLTDDAVDKMAGIFDQVKRAEDFGNGRYVRNLIEKARMAQATRLMNLDVENLSRKEIRTICAEDILLPEEPKEKKTELGFRCA